MAREQIRDGQESEYHEERKHSFAAWQARWNAEPEERWCSMVDEVHNMTMDVKEAWGGVNIHDSTFAG